jgi:hypothetical protein
MPEIILRPGLTWETLPAATVRLMIDVSMVLDILDMVEGRGLGLMTGEAIEEVRKEVYLAAGMDDPRGA